MSVHVGIDAGIREGYVLFLLTFACIFVRFVLYIVVFIRLYLLFILISTNNSCYIIYSYTFCCIGFNIPFNTLVVILGWCLS